MYGQSAACLHTASSRNTGFRSSSSIGHGILYNSNTLATLFNSETEYCTNTSYELALNRKIQHSCTQTNNKDQLNKTVGIKLMFITHVMFTINLNYNTHNVDQKCGTRKRRSIIYTRPFISTKTHVYDVENGN